MFFCACARKPPLTLEVIRPGIADRNGIVQAGDLGWATLTDLKTDPPQVEKDKATVVARVKAEQNALGVNYKLSATLKLHYGLSKQGWELKRTEQVVPWVSRGPPQPKRYTQEMEPGGDSGAIQGLLRARKLARRGLNAIP
jgi:hypothetical protein